MYEVGKFLFEEVKMNLSGLPSGFQVGVLQQAQVLGVVDKRAILLVRGQALGVPVGEGVGVKEGQQLNGRFVQSSTGDYRFEVKESVSPNAAISGRTHLGTFFSNHGIKPSDLNFLVGHKAMQMGQSLTPELFLQIQKLSVLMPDYSESSVHSLLLAISSRFPLKRSTLKLGRDQLIENRGSVALLKSLFGVKPNQALSLNQVRVASKYFPELDSFGFDLRRYFEKSGIDLEAQLRRGLSHSDGEFLRMDEKEFSPFKKLIKNMMSFAKLFQTSAEPLEQVLQIPYLTDGRLEELTLVVGREAADEDGNEEVNSLRVYVDLSNLGPTMIGFQIANGRLDVVLRNEDSRVVDFMESRRSSIIQGMDGVAGFRYVGLRIIQSRVEVPDPFFLDEAIRPRRVDVTV